MWVSDIGYDVVYNRHSTEPEFSMWKENLSHADGIVEPDLALADGTFVSEHPTDGSFPTTIHGDTADLAATAPKFLTTEETGTSTFTDDVLTADSSSRGLSHTGVEPSSESEKQEPELDRCSSDGVAELPVTAGGPQNSVHLSAESVTAQPDECQGGQNLINTLPDHIAVVTSLSQATVSSLSADSEDRSSSSVKTPVVSATSNTGNTDDNRLLPGSQVHESLSPENIQPSASESQMVCGSLHRELSLFAVLIVLYRRW